MMAANRPRRALADTKNNGNSNGSQAVAGNYVTKPTPASTKAQLIEEFVKDRTQQLEQDLEIIKQDLRQLIGSTLFKMPKSVRSMTLEQYENKYHVNLIEQLVPPMQPTLGATAPSHPFHTTTPAFGHRSKAQIANATPMTSLRERPFATPATVRAVRRGEAVFSQNGSPLDPSGPGCLVSTVEPRSHRAGFMAGAKHAANGQTTSDTTHLPGSLEFDLSADPFLLLTDPTIINHLDAEAKVATIRECQARLDEMLYRHEQERNGDSNVLL